MHTKVSKCVVWIWALLIVSNTAWAQSNSSPPRSSNPASAKPKSSLLVPDQESESSPKKVTATPVGTGAKPVSKKDTTSEAPSTPAMRKVDRKEMTMTPSPEGGKEYLLKYKLEAGVSIQCEVVHLAKTSTKIDSIEQSSNSRTVSHKSWSIVNVDRGLATFEYRITDIDMSQQTGDDKELRYNSKDDSEPPRQFQAAADSVGKLISTVTIDEQGMIVARSDDSNPPNLGMGDITLPVPSKPIAIGATWEIPRELHIRRDDGTIKKVRFSELFRLDKVSEGVATVAVRSEMITAVTDPKEEAQVLQQLSNGTIRFDIDAGRMISKELAWDKTVVGFAGEGSVMDYSARLEERVTDAKKDVRSKASASKPKATQAK